MASSSIFVLATVLVSSFLLLTNVTGNEIYENRGIKSGNGEKRPFFVGSRYGRSQSDLSNMDSYGKSNTAARLVPRNDKFFFGSRYGKRSSLPVVGTPEEQNQSLTCFYTGVTNLFRCVEKTDPQLNMNEKK